MVRFVLLVLVALAVAAWFGLLPKRNIEPLPEGSGPITRVGRITDLSGSHLVVRDGEGEHRFEIDKGTSIERPVGHQMVRDGDESRLKLGDIAFVSGFVVAGDAASATSISVNSFLTRDGVIVAVGSDYLDVRMRTAKEAVTFSDLTIRIYLAPDAKRDVTRGPISTDDFTVGTIVSFSGFFAENGDWVAQYLNPSSRTATISP